MGNTLSVEEKVYKCAKENDAAQLQTILHQIQRQGGQLSVYLEYQDSLGHTPLIAAASRGNFAFVDLLLKHGAKLHHFTRRPEGTTALHESVQRGHLRVVDLLLQYGANPFVENARGLTCVDIAINKGNVSMVRCLELRSHFTGTLLLKVPKFMGLGTEWKSRWTVVMPRYQFPSPGTAPGDRIARSLLVCYKAPDQVIPACKVWLDGAVARSVVGSRGAGVPQCALSLHKNHALANGAHMTGDPSVGYTMHLRATDGTAQGSHALRRFMEIVNGSRAAPHQPPQPQVQAQPTGLGANGGGIGAAPAGPSSRRPIGIAHHQQSESDEDLARRLQQKYDQEMEEYRRQNPEAARAAAKLANSSQPQPARQSPASSSSFHSIPSAPMYPPIDPTAGNSTEAPTRTNPQLAAQTTQASSSAAASSRTRPAASSGSPEWCAANLLAAQAPPPSAAVPQPPAEQTNSPMASTAATVDEDDGQCVICLSAPATAGFLHGERVLDEYRVIRRNMENVHKCCCKACAVDLKKAAVPTCPMCRQPIDHVILNFY